MTFIIYILFDFILVENKVCLYPFCVRAAILLK